MNKIKFLKKFRIYFIPVPLLINFILIEEFQFLILKQFINNIFITTVLFFILYLIGLEIKKIFKFNTISFSIAFVFLSIFLINNVFLFLNKNLDFYLFTYIYLSILTFLVFINNKSNYLKNINVILIFVLTQFSRILNETFYKISSNGTTELFTSDEIYFWIPTTKNIFENNYYFALMNNPIEGYGLLASYVNALLTLFVSSKNTFNYYSCISNVFLLLFVLFIYESNFSKKIKILTIISFFSIFFTSTWINYLFFNSLLAERVVGYLFGAIFLEILYFENLNNYQYFEWLISCLFGTLIFGKNFLTIVSLFIIFLMFLDKKNIYTILFGGLPLFISVINSVFLKVDYLWINYINLALKNQNNPAFTPQESAVGKFLALILEYIKDKPLSYITFIIFTLSLPILSKLCKTKKVNLVYSALIFNFILISFISIFSAASPSANDMHRYIILPLYLYPILLMNVLEHYMYKSNA